MREGTCCCDICEEVLSSHWQTLTVQRGSKRIVERAINGSAHAVCVQFGKASCTVSGAFDNLNNLLNVLFYVSCSRVPCP